MVQITSATYLAFFWDPRLPARSPSEAFHIPALKHTSTCRKQDTCLYVQCVRVSWQSFFFIYFFSFFAFISHHRYKLIFHIVYFLFCGSRGTRYWPCWLSCRLCILQLSPTINRANPDPQFLTTVDVHFPFIMTYNQRPMSVHSVHTLSMEGTKSWRSGMFERWRKKKKKKLKCFKSIKKKWE